MKVSRSRDVDILVVRRSDEPIDCAKETNGIIAHFYAAGKPVLLETEEPESYFRAS